MTETQSASVRHTELLVCAATEMELAAYLLTDETWEPDSSEHGSYSEPITYLVTGVGIPCALARTLLLTRSISPARILNIGIAGAYRSSSLTIGAVVMGESEVYGDIGFELPGTKNDIPGFQSIQSSPFAGELYSRPLPLALDPQFRRSDNGEDILVRRGCTVNACAGTDATGIQRSEMFGAGFESMEGAAIAQVGLLYGIPVCEVRAISNFAADRDMRPENIRLALNSLRDHLQYCRRAIRG